MAAALEQRAGLAGLTGTGDLRRVLERAADGDVTAETAVEIYVHRLVREIAAMAASAQGLDALVFTGGVGEHASGIRAAAVARLRFLGADLSEAKNAAASGDSDISADGAGVRTLVVTARKDLEIALGVRRLLTRKGE